MKRLKKSQALILSLAMIISLIPMASIKVKAGVTWTPENTHVSTQMSPGDLIMYPPFDEDDDDDTNMVYVTYNSSNGSYLGSASDENGLEVTGYSDPSTGITYSKYRVTSCNYDWDTFSVELTGIAPVVQKTLTGISISSPPYKTSYTEGESFNRQGMNVAAVYSDNSSSGISNYSVNPSGALSTGNSYVTISYSEGVITKTATQGISVKARTTNTYTIQAGAGTGGSISPTGNQNIAKGSDKVFTITPASGYQIDRVVVDGANQGAINSYTFRNVTAGHTITAYFKVSAVKTYPLTVAGSFAPAAGTGNYAAGTNVTINAGTVPGYIFTGWITSDGRSFANAVTTLTMPAYALNITASWAPSGSITPVTQVTTTNLKGTQLTSWDAIAAKLDTLTVKNLNKTSSAVLNVTSPAASCYIPQNVIAHLNARKGVELRINTGSDVSYSFYSDLDNSAFAGSNLSYTAKTGNINGVRQQILDFVEKGPINTNISMHVKLPGAVPGQQAYVYLVNAAGQQTLYLPVTISADGTASFAVIAKVKMAIIY